MTDPRRLIDEREGRWEADLLRAARQERAPTRTRRRTLAGLGLLGAVVPSAAAAATPKTLAVLGLPFVKWMGIGAGMATLVAGGAVIGPKLFGAPSAQVVSVASPAPKAAERTADVRTARTRLPLPPAVSASSPSEPATPPVPAHTENEPVASAAARTVMPTVMVASSTVSAPPPMPPVAIMGVVTRPAPMPSTSSGRMPARPAAVEVHGDDEPGVPGSSRSQAVGSATATATVRVDVAAGGMSPPPSVQATSVESSSLARQIAMIDSARRALKSNAPRASLDWLDRYDRSFPHGDLAQESTVLRVEALMSLGDHAHARQLAESFLQDNPKSSHAVRLRAIVGSTNP